MRDFINDIERITGDIEANFKEGVALFKELSSKRGLKLTFERFLLARHIPDRIYDKLIYELEQIKETLPPLPIPRKVLKIVDAEAITPSASIVSEPSLSGKTGEASTVDFKSHSIPSDSPSFIQELFNEYKRLIAKRTHLHVFLFEEIGKSDEEVYEYQLQIWDILKRENEIWAAINAYKKDGTIKVNASIYYQMGVQDSKTKQSLASQIALVKRALKKADKAEQIALKEKLAMLTAQKEELINKMNGG